MIQLHESLTGPVWHYFGQILKLPRPSGRESEIVSFLQRFALEHHLHCSTDTAGNVLITKPANANAEPIIFQAHVDMVCVADASATDNPALGQITPRIVEEDGRLWLAATHTTLGADDGIGVAACLALLAANDIQHGTLYCLFTTDEETGLTGAKALTADFLPARRLVNLDSEEENIIYVGCAGGCTTKAHYILGVEPAPTEQVLGIEIDVSGLTGGHSGSDIHLGRANAIKLMGKMLRILTKENGFRLATAKGGVAHNAIPTTCIATGFVPFSQREKVRVAFNIAAADMQEEYECTDPNMHWQMQTTDVPPQVITPRSQEILLAAIDLCPTGAQAMDDEIDDLTVTSTNLATMVLADGKAHFGTSQRSLSNVDKEDIQDIVEDAFKQAVYPDDNVSLSIETSEGYPSWSPNYHSQLLKDIEYCYQKVTGEQADVRVIHAGLECGLFLDKNPYLEMVSIGPTLQNVHTTSERIDVLSVNRFWNVLKHFLWLQTSKTEY